TAAPADGYHFVQWSDGGATATRQETNVTADLAVTAEFAINMYTVTFLAGANGSILGPTPQIVSHGGNTTEVTAEAARGYVFERWDDGSTANSRVLTHVATDNTLTALFRQALPVDPEGLFVASVDETDVLVGQRGIWDFSGAYATVTKGIGIALEIVHDTKGKVTGNGTLTLPGTPPVTLPVTVKGKVSGKAGVTTLSLALKGSAAEAKVSARLTLVLNVAARQLAGPAAIKGKAGDDAINEVIPLLVLDVPAPMDGTYDLFLTLLDQGKAIAGDAILILSNGDHYLFLVKGKRAGSQLGLALKGDPSDPPAKGIKIKTTVTTLEGGQALLDAAAIKAFGQAFAW
ncbi:MAG: hypothetical protein JXR77_08455, partial [Lentisphaeria bacterium]|nr:hypothetical protein [Lentisphaeria bacterium]